MIHCRYVGSDESTVGDREFGRIGEVAMFSESLFVDVVVGAAPFIPEAGFKRVGFSAEELAAFGLPENRDLAPASFLEKLEAAQQVFLDLRARVLKEGLAGVAIAEVSDNCAAEATT